MSALGRRRARPKDTGGIGIMRFRRHGDRQGGQILILFSLVLVVLLAFASLVIDLGVLRNNRQTLVNGVDASLLAGGNEMPTDGTLASVNKVLGLINTTMAANYPGITPADYTVSYRCVIGVDATGTAYVSRDVPAVCDPTHAVGHVPTTADFTSGAGTTRYSICNPVPAGGALVGGDKCNTIVITASKTTAFGFGRVVGVSSGTTGTISAAACTGPCGSSPTQPVDLVVIIDRTLSMSAANVIKTKLAAQAVMSVFDPAQQRIALGLLGPSDPFTTCSGTGGPAVLAKAFVINAISAPAIASSGAADVQTAQNSATPTALTILKPTSSAIGNLLLASITFTGLTSAQWPTPPPTLGGQNWQVQVRNDNLANVSMVTYYHVVTAADAGAASYTWVFPASVRASGAITRWTGVDTAIDQFGNVNPIDGSSPGQATQGIGNNTTPTALNINTSRDHTTLVAVFGMANNTTFAANGTNGQGTNTFTKRLTVANAAGPTTMIANGLGPVAAGATGTKAWTANASGQWVAQLIALKPITYGTNPNNDWRQWIPIGFTGTDGMTPAPTYNEAYSTAGGVINTASHLASPLDTIKAGNAACFDQGSGQTFATNLSTPVNMATYYLSNFGRPNAKWAILLETDGEPFYNGTTGDQYNYDCQAANDAATAAKGTKNALGQGIELFTVGFNLTGNHPCPDGSGGGYRSTTWNGKQAALLLATMATQPSLQTTCVAAANTDGDHFFCEPAAGNLTADFTQVAAVLAGQPHLIQLNPTPIVTSVAPAAGLPGSTVTINGKFFTGADGVFFGATSATILTVSDTVITARVPAGPGLRNITVHTLNGGTSPIVAADQFTIQ